MNKGLCERCKYKSYDAPSLCHHSVVAEVTESVTGDDPFISNFSEATIRAKVRKKLGLQFQPYSWAVSRCEGFSQIERNDKNG